MEDIKQRIVIKTANPEPEENSSKDFRTLLKEASSTPAEPLEIAGLPERFEPVKILGQGGMGTVYQVRDNTLGSDFAIKCMSSQSLPDETARQRFKLEAAAVHDLVHPNIAQVYDYSVDVKAPYIVMEYVPGASFDRILARERIIEQQRLLNMILQICDALSHAHLHGVVHRDLKPSNIILHESSDLVKLVDFGIAKVGPQNESATQLTQKGEVFGSPAYMSPEQARAGKVDHRTDLYSLGCIIYEALAGKPLFEGENAVQILLQHIDTSPLNQTRKLLKKGYSKSLVAILEKLLEKEADKRYQSAAELAQDIRRVRGNQLSFALMKKPFLISISKKALIAGVAGTCVLGMLGLSAYTTITVMQLKNSPNETKVLDSMISKRNQAKELIDKFQNSKGEERTLALHALRSLMATQSNEYGRSHTLDLLSSNEQLALVNAFNGESTLDAKKEILGTLANVNRPEQASMELASRMSVSGDEIISSAAVACLSSWAADCDKKQQPELSTTLSKLLLKQAASSEDSANAIHCENSVYTALNSLGNYSDEAIKNIRESTKIAQAEKEDGSYSNYPHPLIHVSKLKKIYYPELTLLLKNTHQRNYTLPALVGLGPKAISAVPELLKLLKSKPHEYYRSNIYAALASIGPAAATEVVPALKQCYASHRMNELASIASTLTKMGPLGIAVLKEEAARPRSPYTPDDRSPNYLNNAAIDAAKDALESLAEN